MWEMTIMYQDIDRAAQIAGIADSFTAIDGSTQLTSIETKVNLLAAMNDFPCYPLPDDPSPLRAAYVFRQGQRYQIQLDQIHSGRWILKCEDGQKQQGTIDDSAYLTFAEDLAVGYHQLMIETDDRHWLSRVIIAPERCFEPPMLNNGQRVWGVSVQLYTVRSENNWGIGDFSDLHVLIDEISQRGGAFIGLNPIHALYPANPESASPYSPSSRRWLNILYIDISAIEEFQRSEEAQSWLYSDLIQEKLSYVRKSEWIDYRAVAGIKIQGLRLAFKAFQQSADDDRRVDFNAFIENNGLDLRRHATFDALHSALNVGDENRWGWPVWPAEFQDVNGDSVRQFAENNPDEILFFSWLQWLAFMQLSDCDRHCRQSGMSIGLYRDLAVGASFGGADVWSDKQLYSTGAAIGAPADPLGPLGQNWGLSPLNPHTLQSLGYQPFIDILRSNMALCGAMRIDHVMSLLRLWWIPNGEPADRGAYVYYPVDDLIGILALESQRHQCLAIGEDLGTVPPEIVDKLKSAGIYSYRVLYFQHGGNNDFFLPQDYPSQAMASINTHDLPTLRSFWLSNDLTMGSALKLYPDRDKLYTLYNERNATKHGLLQALHHAGYSLNEDPNVTVALPISEELSLAILRYMSSSHSLLLGIQLEDLLGMLLPVNIPGTSEQYANWRRKLSIPLSEMFSDVYITHLFDEVNQIRRALNL
jgi:4-alpha-glucanotransferase